VLVDFISGGAGQGVMSPPAESTSAYAVIRALLAFADAADCRGQRDGVEQILRLSCP
jgi:hypothetical protein